MSEEEKELNKVLLTSPAEFRETITPRVLHAFGFHTDEEDMDLASILKAIMRKKKSSGSGEGVHVAANTVSVVLPRSSEPPTATGVPVVSKPKPPASDAPKKGLEKKKKKRDEVGSSDLGGQKKARGPSGTRVKLDSSLPANQAMTMPRSGGKGLFSDSNIARAITPGVIPDEVLHEAIEQKVDFEDEFTVSSVRVSTGHPAL